MICVVFDATTKGYELIVMWKFPNNREHYVIAIFNGSLANLILSTRVLKLRACILAATFTLHILHLMK